MDTNRGLSTKIWNELHQQRDENGDAILEALRLHDQHRLRLDELATAVRWRTRRRRCDQLRALKRMSAEYLGDRVQLRDTPDPCELAIRSEQIAKVRMAIHRISSPVMQATARRRWIDGISASEISRESQCTVKAIHQRLARAKVEIVQNLRSTLNSEGIYT